MYKRVLSPGPHGSVSIPDPCGAAFSYVNPAGAARVTDAPRQLLCPGFLRLNRVSPAEIPTACWVLRRSLILLTSVLPRRGTVRSTFSLAIHPHRNSLRPCRAGGSICAASGLRLWMSTPLSRLAPGAEGVHGDHTRGVVRFQRPRRPTGRHADRNLRISCRRCFNIEMLTGVSKGFILEVEKEEIVSGPNIVEGLRRAGRYQCFPPVRSNEPNVYIL